MEPIIVTLRTSFSGPIGRTGLQNLQQKICMHWDSPARRFSLVQNEINIILMNKHNRVLLVKDLAPCDYEVLIQETTRYWQEFHSKMSLMLESGKPVIFAATLEEEGDGKIKIIEEFCRMLG